MSETPILASRSLWSDAFLYVRSRPLFWLCSIVLFLLILAVCIVPFFLPYQYDQLDYGNINSAPNIYNGHFFGTDSLGRDLLARLLQGGRISLGVGLAATAVSLLIGVIWGAIAGFIGGKTDALMMRLVDILYAMPFMFFVILLMVLFGRHIILLFAAIGAVNWLDMARIVRGQTLTLKNREFISAARLMGASSQTIIFKHIVPNLLGIVIVYATLTVPQIILAESFLSFLGLGVQEPATSWGALVDDGQKNMETAPWLLIFPSAFLITTLLCFNYLGDILRDALDPKR